MSKVYEVMTETLATCAPESSAAHVAAIERLGVLPVHRRSFGPVKRCLALGQQALAF